MSNLSEAELASLYRFFKQVDSDSQRLDSHHTHSAGASHLASQPPYQTLHRPSAIRHRPQPYRQMPPLRNASEFSAFSRNLEEIKRQVNEVHAALDIVQNGLEQIRVMVEENMTRMNGNMERFEVIGRNFLKQAVQPSNSQPPNGTSSQPQTSSNTPPLGQHASQQPTSSNLQNSYGQGPHATRPSTSFVPLTNPSQSLYAPPPSQAQESFPDANYMDYSNFDFDQA